MVGAVDGDQAAGLDVGINLRGADVGVAEQDLDRAQVGSAFEQVGGKEWRRLWGEIRVETPATRA